MSKDLSHIDVSQRPVLRELAEEVARTKQVRVLRDAQGELAMVVPAIPAGATFVPTTKDELREVFRATYSLKEPLTWDEIKTIAEEEAAHEAARGWAV